MALEPVPIQPHCLAAVDPPNLMAYHPIHAEHIADRLSRRAPFLSGQSMLSRSHFLMAAGVALTPKACTSALVSIIKRIIISLVVVAHELA